jgi:hypothetical protein
VAPAAVGRPGLPGEVVDGRNVRGARPFALLPRWCPSGGYAQRKSRQDRDGQPLGPGDVGGDLLVDRLVGRDRPARISRLRR